MTVPSILRPLLLLVGCGLLMSGMGCRPLPSPEEGERVDAAPPQDATVADPTSASAEGGEASDASSPENPPAAEEVAPEPEPEPIDTTSKVAILGYHRFADTPNISQRLLPTTIYVEKFRAQMQTLVDNEIPVISLSDFLAWRRGERNLPPFSVIITIDDGWKSTYDLALPVLKEFSFPFTIYFYTAFLNSGGKTLSFEQIDEMIAAGGEIGSHSVSHQDLRKRGRRSEEMHQAYLKEEAEGSKRALHERLGIDPVTFSYPYGVYNDQVIAACEAAGYEAMVTVRGEKVGWETDLRELGRYIVHGEDDRPFNWALSSSVPGGLATANNLLKQTQTDEETGEERPLVSVTPRDGSSTQERHPEISVDLSAVAGVDADSLSLYISGMGEVRADFDPETKTLSYRPTQRLRQPEYWAQVKFQREDAEEPDIVRWKFSIDAIPNYLELAPQAKAAVSPSTEATTSDPESLEKNEPASSSLSPEISNPH